MTNIPTSEIDDDALGVALRAFVDQSLANGIDRDDVIYALAVSMVRISIELQTEHASALRVILQAANDVAKLSSGIERASS